MDVFTHVIATKGEGDAAHFDCPSCGQEASNSPLNWWEVADNTRAVFCGRWGCHALLYVHANFGEVKQ